MVKINKTKVREGIIEITRVRTIKTKVRMVSQKIVESQKILERSIVQCRKTLPIKCVVVITAMVLLRGTVWPH